MELMIFIAGAFSGAVITSISIGAMMKEDKVEITQDFTVRTPKTTESELVQKLKQSLKHVYGDLPNYVDKELMTYADSGTESAWIDYLSKGHRDKIEEYLTSKGIKHERTTIGAVKVPMEQFYE